MRLRTIILSLLAGLTLSASAAAHITNKIWLVIYDPFPTNSGREHLWQVFDPTETSVLWNDPALMNDCLLRLLQMDTHSNVVFICNRTNIFRFFPLLTNRQRYYYDKNGPSETNNYYWSYTSPWSQRGWPGAMLDYDYMLTNDLQGEAILGTGVCDDVWVWCPPMAGAYESHMFGPGSWWCNSGGHTGNNGYRAYPRRFIVYVFNYERGVDMANHDFGHAMESHMSQFNAGWHWNYATRFDAAVWTSYYWGAFAAFDQAMPGRAGCGDTHRMPNSTNEYQYNNQNYVWSFKRNWEGTNFIMWPTFTMSNWINATEWHDAALESWAYKSEGECSHLRWWFQHMPHEPPDSPYYMTNGLLMNWYEYLWNYNRCGLGLSNNVERYEGPCCDLRGYLTFYIDVPEPWTNALVVSVNGTRNVDLYLRREYLAIPNDNGVTYGVWDAVASGASSAKTITLTPTTSPPLRAGRWYITVHAPYQSKPVHGSVRVRASYGALAEPPTIVAPVFVAAGATQAVQFAGATNIVIHGVKGTNQWVTLAQQTNMIVQTYAGTNWQMSLQLEAHQNIALDFSATRGDGLFTAPTHLDVAVGAPGLICYDGAVYTANALVEGQVGGYNWATAWSGSNTIGADGLAYQDDLKLLVTNGNRFVAISAWRESHRLINLATWPALQQDGCLAPDGTSIWLSVLLRQDGTQLQNCFGGIYLKNGKGGGTLYLGRAWGEPRWRIESGTGTNFYDVTTTDRETALLVMRIDFRTGNEQCYIWLNPSLGYTPPADAAALLFDKFDFTFNDVFLAAGFTDISVDELRIGESWAAVTPFQLIPEPSGLVPALSALLLARRTVRRRGYN